MIEGRGPITTSGSRKEAIARIRMAPGNGAIVVNTNPLLVMRRDDNEWHTDQVEVTDT